MASKLIECVPNFSEGRDPAVIFAIERAIESVRDIALLSGDSDPDHNRSVFTFAGPPDAVAEAALRGISAAVGRIDLRRHTGVHPRIGAADVVPFVPLADATLEDCREIAHHTGRKVWESLGVPVYFYEAAASEPERVPLENVRRGGFESPRLVPDIGGSALHPTAGACVIGARKLLIAYNINLNSTDIAIARAIARKIRASSGGLPSVKAMGVSLASRSLVQVSMNLTDFEVTSPRQVYDLVQQEAAEYGVSIESTEIVGMIPRAAVDEIALPNLDPSRVLKIL